MNKLIKIILILELFLLPFSKAQAELEYNYQSTRSIPIKLAITQNFSTKEPLNEGEKLEFYIVEDVYNNNSKILTKGTIINATLETIISSGMNGFPAEIIIDNFEIPGIKSSQLIETYVKKGKNKCFWVYPLKWALTPIPFVGSLTNLIRGGHAVIKTKDIITIQYYPDWK